MSAFIERSRFGMTCYRLKGDRICLSGKRFLRPFYAEFELRSLGSGIERGFMPFMKAVWYLLAFAGLSGWGTFCLIRQKTAPLAAVAYPAECLGIFAIGCLITAARCMSRPEAVIFRDVVGKKAFSLLKEECYAGEFERFVAQIQSAIQQSKRRSHDEPLPPEPTDDETSDPVQAPPRQRNWNWSLLCGVVAYGIKWAGPRSHVPDGFTLLFYFCAVTGALTFTVLSFQAREKLAWLSTAGAVVGFIPALFY